MMNYWPTSFLALIVICGMLLTLGACGSSGDDPLAQTSEQEKVVGLLTNGTGTWSPSATNGIMLEDFDVTEEFFTGFTIRFTGNQLFTTGTTPMWLRQDTWQFKSGSSSVIVRGQDDNEVTIESISETQLKLTLQWAYTTFDGRRRSLPGRYTFILNK